LGGFAGWYVAQAWGEFPLLVYLLMAGVPFLGGVLWLLAWVYKRSYVIVKITFPDGFLWGVATAS
jgi:hypothetical protein